MAASVFSKRSSLSLTSRPFTIPTLIDIGGSPSSDLSSSLLICSSRQRHMQISLGGQSIGIMAHQSGG